jgi:predicted proteasome-type protease
MGLFDVRRFYTRLVCSRNHTARPYEKVIPLALVSIDNDFNSEIGHGKPPEVLTR